MATRKDLLKAHKFTSDRLVAALVMRDPDRVDSPLRRVVMGSFASVMIGVVIVAAFGVIGLLGIGKNTTWKESDSVIVVDSQAGQVYWYRKPILYPMENLTSAKLASAGAEVVSLKSKSLQGVERGERLGIAGAPGSPPAAADLEFYPAQVCATAPDDQQRRHTTLAFGSAAEPAGDAVPVVLLDAEQREYLVVDGTAHLIPKADGVARSPLQVLLGFPTFANAYGLLSTIPVGTELSPERILKGVANVGRPSQNGVGEARNIGDLVQIQGSDETYVVLADGLSRIRPLELKALQAAGHQVSEVSSQEAAAHISPSRDSIGAADLPTRMPELPSTPGMENGPLCATWASADDLPVLSVDVTPPEVKLPVEDERLADVVLSEPGRGALLVNTATSGPPQSGVLVIDGLRYGIADPESLGALGYGDAEMDRTSAAIMDLIPEGLPGGVALSVDLAGRPPQR